MIEAKPLSLGHPVKVKPMIRQLESLYPEGTTGLGQGRGQGTDSMSPKSSDPQADSVELLKRKLAGGGDADIDAGINTGWQTLDRLGNWPTVGNTYHVFRKAYRDVKSSHDLLYVWCSAAEKAVGLGNFCARWFLPPLWVTDRVASKCVQVVEDLVPIVKQTPEVVYTKAFETATKTASTAMSYGLVLTSPLENTFVETGVTTICNYNLSIANAVVDFWLSPGAIEAGCKSKQFDKLSIVEKAFCVAEKITVRSAALTVRNMRLFKKVMVGVLERINSITRMMLSLTGIPFILRRLKQLRNWLEVEVKLMMTPGDEKGIVARTTRLLVNIYVTLNRAVSFVTGAARYTAMTAVRMMESVFDFLANQSGITFGGDNTRSRSSSDDLGSDNSEEYRGPAKLAPSPHTPSVRPRVPSPLHPSPSDTDEWQNRAESDWAKGVTIQG